MGRRKRPGSFSAGSSRILSGISRAFRGSTVSRNPRVHSFAVSFDTSNYASGVETTFRGARAFCAQPFAMAAACACMHGMTGMHGSCTMNFSTKGRGLQPVAAALRPPASRTPAWLEAEPSLKAPPQAIRTRDTLKGLSRIGMVHAPSHWCFPSQDASREWCNLCSPLVPPHSPPLHPRTISPYPQATRACMPCCTARLRGVEGMVQHATFAASLYPTLSPSHSPLHTPSHSPLHTPPRLAPVLRRHGSVCPAAPQDQSAQGLL